MAFFAAPTFAQVSVSRGQVIEAKINFQGHTIEGAFLVIQYSIPYSGMVEIRLYDESGLKIWQNQYEHEVGDNRIVLKASKLIPGQTYAYVLNYKQDQLRQEFVVPEMGYE